MAPHRAGLRAGLVGLAMLCTLAGTTVATAGTASAATGIRFVGITAPDGVVLSANVVEPTTAGRHPAVVFISSWGVNDVEYLAQATALAGRGYTVLSYTPRGWWDSGGKIEVAGPVDVRDVSTVLDWLVANTTVDPARIGAAGVSYGSGIGAHRACLDAVNGDHPALVPDSACGGSLRAPSPLLGFHLRPTDPEHLEVAPGDHALRGRSGLVGLANHLVGTVGPYVGPY